MSTATRTPELGLRELLMGDDGPEVHRALERHIRGLRSFLPTRYGESLQMQQTLLEVDVLLDLPCTPDGLACKRAAVLFALWREREVMVHFERLEHRAQKRARGGDAKAPGGAPSGSFARDLAERVLPFLGPLFLRNSCQAPDAFVVAVLVLAELWAGEPLGNYPRSVRRREAAARAAEEGAGVR